MISEAFAKEQILRLSQMRNFPLEKPAMRDLTDELMSARSEKEATAVITAFKDGATGETPCPMPSEIRTALQALLEDYRPDPNCNGCGGAGWLIVEKGGRSGAAKCGCWRRRPAPPIPGPGDTPVGEIPGQIRELAEARRLK